MSVIERASVCTFDCPDTCSLTVTVEDGRITKVRGSDAAPFTAGVICNKVAQRHGRVRARTAAHPASAAPHRPEGLRRSSSASPGTRRWTKSTRATSAVIERWGPQAVTPLNYAGPHGLLAGDSMSSRFFHKLGATPALSPLDVRRRAQRGLGRNLWRGARLPAGIRRGRAS